jgi:hypothetical protein
MPKDERRLTSHIYQRFEIFDLALYRIRPCVSTIAACAPVVREYSEIGGRSSGEVRLIRASLGCATH